MTPGIPRTKNPEPKTMTQLIAPQTTLIDVKHLHTTEVIASALLESDGGLALIDPGPTSCLGNLEAGLDTLGLSIGDLSMILLTHIHLDHAGATGTLVRKNPSLQVVVHERGTPHLVDPSRLIKSATRVFGSQMDRMWGDFESVPSDRITSLQGGETITLGKRQLSVAYTPGHASHHVSYFDPSIGVAFVGDMGGIRMSNRPCILPVTPPPEINLEEWVSTTEKIREWQPESLFLTHFGSASPVDEHLDVLIAEFQVWSDRVQKQLAGPGTDEEHAEEFGRRLREDVVSRLGESEAQRYEIATASKMSWYGLARYLRKKAA